MKYAKAMTAMASAACVLAIAKGAWEARMLGEDGIVAGGGGRGGGAR